MKKLIAIILSVCMMLSLAACGGSNDGITIRNDLGCGIEDIYMIVPGSDSWGEDVTGYIDPGAAGYIYPQTLFGSSKLEVDILIVDEYDTFYTFTSVPIQDGQSYYVKVDDEGDVLFICEDDYDLYIGEIDAGNPYALLTNDLDVDIAELQLSTTDGYAEFDIIGFAAWDSYELSLTERFGSPKAVVEILLVDEYGDSFRFEPIELCEGTDYRFDYDELDNPILVNERTGAEYASDRLEGGASDHILSDLEGVWEISGEDAFLLFYGDLTWDWVSSEGEILGSGEYEFLGKEVAVHTGNGISTFRWDEDDDLYCEENDVLLCFAVDFDSEDYAEFRDYVQHKQTWFGSLGYQINYEMGEGTSYMSEAMYGSSSDGSYYEIMPMTVRVDRLSCDDTQDGYVEITFQETAQLDAMDYSAALLSGDNIIGVTTVLCDAYTGYWLVEDSTHGDTSQGDNDFYYEYQSQGRTVCVNFSYSTSWELTNDGSLLFTKVYFVRMPADYDGIVYAHATAWPDYASLAANQTKSSDDWGPVEDERLEYALICTVNP